MEAVEALVRLRRKYTLARLVSISMEAPRAGGPCISGGQRQLG
jgi:hypothetical protein